MHGDADTSTHCDGESSVKKAPVYGTHSDLLVAPSIKLMTGFFMRAISRSSVYSSLKKSTASCRVSAFWTDRTKAASCVRCQSLHLHLAEELELLLLLRQLTFDISARTEASAFAFQNDEVAGRRLFV